MNNAVNMLSDAYNLLSTSPEAEDVDMTFDMATDGNSAFVDIFGANASARITIYKDGNCDFEMISGEETYKYEYKDDLKSKDDIYKIIIQAINKTK